MTEEESLTKVPPAFGGRFTHNPVEVTAAQWDGRDLNKLAAMAEHADPRLTIIVDRGTVTVGSTRLKVGDWYGINQEGKFIVWSEEFFLANYTPSKLLT